MHTHSRTRERPHARTHTWPHTHTPADAQAVPCQARPAGQPGLTFHGGGRAGHDHIRCRALSETRLGRRPRQSRAMWQDHDENSAPDPLARRARLPARTDSTPYAAAAVAAAQASCYRISCCQYMYIYLWPLALPSQARIQAGKAPHRVPLRRRPSGPRLHTHKICR